MGFSFCGSSRSIAATTRSDLSLSLSSDVSSRPGSRAVRHSSQMPTVTALSLRPHRCAFVLAGLRCLLRMPGPLPGLAALYVRSGSYSGLCRGFCFCTSLSRLRSSSHAPHATAGQMFHLALH